MFVVCKFMRYQAVSVLSEWDLHDCTCALYTKDMT